MVEELKYGFNRIVQYTGFVFDDKESIDHKVWKTKEVENVTDITLDKDGMCKVSVEGIESAYLIFPKSKIELIELIDE